MTAPIKIQLSSEALASMFPEGSPARVELQHAVVAEFVRKHIHQDTLGKEVAEQIDRGRTDALSAITAARQAVTDRALLELGVKKEWSRYVLSAEVAAAITAGVKTALYAAQTESINQLVTASVDKLRGTIEHNCNAAVNRLVADQIAEQVKAKVAAVIKAI